MKNTGIEGTEEVGEIAGVTAMAELVTLPSVSVGGEVGTSAIAGTALRVQVSKLALEAARREKRGKHRFGMYQHDRYAIGAVALHIGQELYVVSLDLGSSQGRGALAEACVAKRLPVILQGEDGESEMLLLPADASLQGLWNASQEAHPMNVPTFVRLMKEVIERLIGTVVVELLVQERTSLRTVHSCYVMSEILTADLERRLLGPTSIQ